MPKANPRPTRTRQQQGTGEERAIKGRYSVSHSFPDGAIADMVYSKFTERIAFAVSRKGETCLLEELMLDKEGNLTPDESSAIAKLIPARSVRDLIDKNFINVATGGEEYGTLKDLHAALREHIQKYVFLEDDRFYDVAIVYVLMSWVFDRFNTVPYLRVIGDMGTGKSRFLEVIGKLCNRSMMASGSISMAAVYRTLDLVQGTLVFDEADFKSSDMSDDIVKILNGGHKKDTPVVRMECVNDVFKTTSFRVFGPKILGSRRSFADSALESRCITHRMFPQKSVTVPVHLPVAFEPDTQILRNKLLMFRLRNYHHIQDDESSLSGLDFPRLRQTALALTSIAKMIDEETLKSVLGFLVEYEQSFLNTVATDTFADILLCISRLMETNEDVRKSGVMHMNLIANSFNDQFFDDYTERDTPQVNTREGILFFPSQRVSAKKIGGYIDKLGIAKERDSHGVFIPLHKEAPRIMSLVERYGLVDILAKLRENDKKKIPITRTN